MIENMSLYFISVLHFRIDLTHIYFCNKVIHILELPNFTLRENNFYIYNAQPLKR